MMQEEYVMSTAKPSFGALVPAPRPASRRVFSDLGGCKSFRGSVIMGNDFYYFSLIIKEHDFNTIFLKDSVIIQGD